jgi:hypothetical protein
MMPAPAGDTKQSLLESTTEITQNKHVKVLHYFVDDIKWLTFVNDIFKLILLMF